MSKENTISKVNKLIDLGKEKGFLTYDEVNDILPSDIFSPKQIDDIMIIFGDMNIEIVEAMQKVKIPQSKLQKIPEEVQAETKVKPQTVALKEPEINISALRAAKQPSSAPKNISADPFNRISALVSSTIAQDSGPLMSEAKILEQTPRPSLPGHFG